MKSMATETALDGVKAFSDAPVRSPVARVTIVAADQELAKSISAYLTQNGGAKECKVTAADAVTATFLGSVNCVLYLPSLRRYGTVPNLAEAENFFRACKESGVCRIVLIASAAVYGASFRNPGLVPESYPTSKSDRGVASEWKKLEETAKAHFSSAGQLVVLAKPCSPDRWRLPSFAASQRGSPL